MVDEAKEQEEITPNQLVASSVDFPIEGGQVISWDDDLEYGSAKRPRLSVAVRSGSEIPHDAQSRITPVIQDEMERFMQGATATYITQSPEPITLRINSIPGQTLTPLPMQSQHSVVSELRSSNQGDISVLGPYVKREVTVETDYNIETSHPEPLPIKNPAGGLIVTKKKTLKTTTKEVTTTVKQVCFVYTIVKLSSCKISSFEFLIAYRMSKRWDVYIDRYVLHLTRASSIQNTQNQEKHRFYSYYIRFCGLCGWHVKHLCDI